MDINNDGDIDLFELNILAKKFGHSPEMFWTILKTMDKDKNNKISWKEFASFMVYYLDMKSPRFNFLLKDSFG